MLIRVTINDMSVEAECKSAEEAAAFVRDLGTPGTSESSQGMAPQAVATRDPDYAGFWKALKDADKQGLKALRSEAGVLETKEFATKMGIEPLKIKYAIRRISSAAQKHGIEREDLVKYENGNYAMSAKSRKALSEMT